MAVGQFEVDPALLKSSATEIRQYLGVLKEMRTELQDKMIEVSAMWEGPAKEVFHARFQKSCADFITICKQLDEALESVDHAAKEYEVCDERVRGIVDAIVI